MNQTLRKAQKLTEERNRKSQGEKQRQHEEGMQEAIKAIEEAHAKGQRTATTTGLPDSVMKELRSNGYKAKREKPDEFVSPSYNGEVTIEWD